MELPTNITSTNLADGDVAIRYLHEQEKIRRARSKRRWITAGAILAGMFVLMVGCGVAVGAAASGSSSSAAAVPASVPASASAPSRLHEETRTIPEPPAAVSAPVAPVPTESASAASGMYGPGTYVVGRDIPAGDYWTPGSTTGHSGYASRMSGTSGDFSETLGVVSVPENGPAQVTVLASDRAVEFYGTDIVWVKV